MTSAGAVTVRLRESAATTGLPEAVVQYAARTQEPVLLDDASAGGPFSGDEYIRRQRARSILCLPLVKQGRLVALQQFTLQERLQTDVVTSSRKAFDVAETQFALWTWYRLTYYGRNEERKKNRDNFFKDQWVQDRRAYRIAHGLKGLGCLDIARSYLGTDDNVAAIIAWVEFEGSVRNLLGTEKATSARNRRVIDLIGELPVKAVPRSREELKHLWVRDGRGRNQIIHHSLKLTRKEAEEVVNDVVEFLAHNS